MMPSPTDFITLRLMPRRSSRLIPGLRGHAGGDDADIGAREVGVGVGARERGVEAFGRAGLRDVQRLALRRAFGDVEQDDVAQFLERDEMGERAADLSGADEGDLGSGHGTSGSVGCCPDA